MKIEVVLLHFLPKVQPSKRWADAWQKYGPVSETAPFFGGSLGRNKGHRLQRKRRGVSDMPVRKATVLTSNNLQVTVEECPFASKAWYWKIVRARDGTVSQENDFCHQASLANTASHQRSKYRKSFKHKHQMTQG